MVKQSDSSPGDKPPETDPKFVLPKFYHLTLAAKDVNVVMNTLAKMMQAEQAVISGGRSLAPHVVRMRRNNIYHLKRVRQDIEDQCNIIDGGAKQQLGTPGSEDKFKLLPGPGDEIPPADAGAPEDEAGKS